MWRQEQEIEPELASKSATGACNTEEECKTRADVNLRLYILRVKYLNELKGSIVAKIAQFTEEADKGAPKNEQTFQRWFADQIVHSSSFLSLQFTEQVLSASYAKLQNQKSENLKQLLILEGKTDSEKYALKEAAEAVLEPLGQLDNEMTDTYNRLCAQMAKLNKLCLKQRNASNYEDVQLIVDCQSSLCASMGSSTEREINHIDTIAKLYISANPNKHQPIAKTVREIKVATGLQMREFPIVGGKDTHEVKLWPDETFFKDKTREQLKPFRVSRIDWSTGKYLDSVRFTMSNGDVSPKFGSKAFNNYCQVNCNITQVRIAIKNKKLVGMVLYTGQREELMVMQGSEAENAVHTDLVLAANESIVGFSGRTSSDKALTGFGFTILE